MQNKKNKEADLQYILYEKEGDAENKKKCVPASSDEKSIDLLDEYSRAVIAVVDAVGPSVVSITVGDSSYNATGAGSGVVIAPDGYILTNSHVVSGQKKIEIILTDGEGLKADIIGDDPPTDLAIVKVNTKNIPFSVIGESSQLKVGQLVIAMGNPFGFQSTVSTGVISSLGRSLRARDGRLIEDIIQHTAPLNPGNSGGPLLNTHGKIIGINTAIIAIAQGIGFSISAQTIEWVVTQILTKGKVKRVYLGLSGQSRKIGPRYMHYHKLTQNHVLEIIFVEKDGPANKADLHAGDFIYEINGLKVQSIDDVHHILSEWPAGKEIKLKIIRTNEKLDKIIIPQEKE